MKQTVALKEYDYDFAKTSLAIKNKCEYLWYAAHSGDHEIYPDCRPEFSQKLGDVLSSMDYHEINLKHPL